MSKSYTGSTKCCATCTHWAGPRTAKYNTYSETAGPGVKGKCHAGVSSASTQGHDDCGGYNCAKYQKWSALK